MLRFQWPPLDAALREHGSPHMNKFEQVSSDHHQKILAEGLGPNVQREEVPYGVSYPIIDFILPTLPHPFGQTDFCENVTFPQVILGQ